MKKEKEPRTNKKIDKQLKKVPNCSCFWKKTNAVKKQVFWSSSVLHIERYCHDQDSIKQQNGKMKWDFPNYFTKQIVGNITVNRSGRDSGLITLTLYDKHDKAILRIYADHNEHKLIKIRDAHHCVSYDPFAPIKSSLALKFSTIKWVDLDNESKVRTSNEKGFNLDWLVNTLHVFPSILHKK